MRRHLAAHLTTLAATLVLVVATGCSGDDDDSGGGATSSATPTTTPTSTPTPPPSAIAVPAPEDDACYALSYDEAVAPTVTADPVPCARRHSAETYAVGTIANVVDGHLLAVDSERVQADVARACPAGLGAAVGGTVDDLRLSMLRAVWFTPTVEQSDAGADWYRCDVVALAGTERLAPGRGSLRGVLDTPEGRDAYGMCGTAGPDDPDFERVRCSDAHSWRAFSVIDLAGTSYPGRAAITEAGEQPCNDAAGDLADDPLDYEWGFEGPDEEQWDAGQTFVRCWAPD